MDIKIIEQRRKNLVEQLKDNQGVVVFATEGAHTPYRMKQDSNFFYLTGLNIPDAIFVLARRNGKEFSTLYINRNRPEMIVWEGEKMKPEEATKLTGIKSISFLDEFNVKILGNIAGLERLYVNYGSSYIGKPLNRALLWINEVKTHVPSLQFDEFSNCIRALRSVKDEWEIEQMQAAINITGEGLMEIFTKTKPGMFEYQLESLLYHKMLYNGYPFWGFKPIIASGKNAATLHYEENESKIEDNQLVLCDVGAAHNNYSADITRTFPVNDTFSERQKEVYSEVLAIQKEIIEMIKPGVGMKELNEKTIELTTAALKRLNLIEKDEEYRKYYMHSIGHHLGLDTHDVGLREAVLQAGNVITVEPGIYIPEEKIGVRIEDDILVTEDGYKNLSKDIPKEIEELEAIRKKALAL